MQNILITGCSTGIGYETARILKMREYKVYATARKQKDVERLKDFGFEAFYLDVTDHKSIKTVLDTIIEKDGKIDLVFNNAGFGQPGAVEDITTEVLKQQFETNVFGLHELTRQVLPYMRKQGYGKIIQHSSVLGIVSLKFRGAYNASKYAIEGLNDTLRQELMGTNIFISTVNTGPVISDFRKNALLNFKKNIDIENSAFSDIYKKELNVKLESTKEDTPFTLEANSVAQVVLDIIYAKKPKPRYYVTKATTILGFAKRVLSTNLLDKLLNKM